MGDGRWWRQVPSCQGKDLVRGMAPVSAAHPLPLLDPCAPSRTGGGAVKNTLLLGAAATAESMGVAIAGAWRNGTVDGPWLVVCSMSALVEAGVPTQARSLPRMARSAASRVEWASSTTCGLACNPYSSSACRSRESASTVLRARELAHSRSCSSSRLSASWRRKKGARAARTSRTTAAALGKRRVASLEWSPTCLGSCNDDRSGAEPLPG